METLLILLLVAILLVLLALMGAMAWLSMRLNRPASQNLEQVAKLEGKLDAIQRQVESSLQSVTAQVSVFGEVKETLGKVTEATTRVAQLGEDITKLETILQSPNRRGGFGEILLQNLLSQILPEKNFQMQYSFEDKTRVDAAILLGERILPVDSKFPLQGFEEERSGMAKRSGFVRAVKDRIDETSKYIRPGERTFDFAMMYVPAENLYYEIISNNEMFDYAMQKRVIPVSPNSFFAYLQVVVYGLRGMQIEEHAQEILKSLSALRITLNGIQEHYEKLGSHINGAQTKYQELGKKLDKFSSQFDTLASETLPEGSALALLEKG
ncbi:MAG: hypothetical protein Fur0043_01550 [Anaerolineales bacterium]